MAEIHVIDTAQEKLADIDYLQLAQKAGITGSVDGHAIKDFIMGHFGMKYDRQPILDENNHRIGMDAVVSRSEIDNGKIVAGGELPEGGTNQVSSPIVDLARKKIKQVKDYIDLNIHERPIVPASIDPIIQSIMDKQDEPGSIKVGFLKGGATLLVKTDEDITGLQVPKKSSIVRMYPNGQIGEELGGYSVLTTRLYHRDESLGISERIIELATEKPNEEIVFLDLGTGSG